MKYLLLYKKFKNLILLFILIFSLSLVACSSRNNLNNNHTLNHYQIALITDLGTIDDKSFNQGSWNAITSFANNYNMSAQFYQPSEQSDLAILDTIHLAISAGAETVICPGYFFEQPVYQAQYLYPDINFIIIDGVPHDENNNIDIANNTYSILYSESQAGFLAGYSAVFEGYTNLGFMGGLPLPPVINFGYGFIQGADYASQELNLHPSTININYMYLNNFDASPDNLAKASAWYNQGVDIIFACGGAIGNSIMKAAEMADKKVIGVDIDQSFESDTVITSAIKNIENSVYDTLVDINKNTFKGGQSNILGADTQDILLPIENSNFINFTEQDYNNIYSKLAQNQIQLFDSSFTSSPSLLPINSVNIQVY